jgi:hypothetical protein
LQGHVEDDDGLPGSSRPYADADSANVAGPFRGTIGTKKSAGEE